MITVFPVYWMLITAFKQDPDLYRMDLSRSGSTSADARNFEILFYQTNYELDHGTR